MQGSIDSTGAAPTTFPGRVDLIGPNDPALQGSAEDSRSMVRGKAAASASIASNAGDVHELGWNAIQEEGEESHT